MTIADFKKDLNEFVGPGICTKEILVDFDRVEDKDIYVTFEWKVSEDTIGLKSNEAHISKYENEVQEL